MKKALGFSACVCIGVATLVGVVCYNKGRLAGIDWCMDQLEEFCGCYYE